MPLERTCASKRILATGGAGFIGSHLCERLLTEGAEVIWRRQLFYRQPSNMAHLRPNPLFEAMRHDVTFPLYVEVDAIFNLACPASPIHFSAIPCKRPRPAFTGQSTC
jgi:UDP-glucuronate decarboxylase